jgi:hypothetical protein
MKNNMFFGSLAIITAVGSGRPLALRPCLSAGLPLSDWICSHYNMEVRTNSFHLSKVELHSCNGETYKGVMTHA